jgi:hypothetical protein
MGTPSFRALAGAFVLVLAMPLPRAGAQEPVSCTQFAWNLALERTWFASKVPETLASGATTPTLPSAALIVELKPADAVRFVLPPGGKPKPANTFSGIITLASVPASGLYQITLSDEGWVDVIQNNQLIASESHTGKRDCPGVRKSVRFLLKAAPATIQLSGVPSSTIKVVIRPAGD